MKEQLNKLAKSSALVIIALAAICTTGYAQSNDLSAGDSQNSTTLTKENVGAGITMPEFPGGDIALRKFIADNIRYPEEAKLKGLSGKVFVQFIVDKNGDVVNPKIARGIDPILDNEAIRVVQSLPKWKPGEQSERINGEKVLVPKNVSYTVPIAFNIAEPLSR